MKYATIILSCLVLNLFSVHLANARLLVVSFSPSAAEAYGLVAGYGLYYQPTNTTDPNTWYYLSCCGPGNTNMYTDSSLIIGNPVWIAGNAISRNWVESGYSPRVLYDTNVWFAALAAAAKAAGTPHKAPTEMSLPTTSSVRKLPADRPSPAVYAPTPSVNLVQAVTNTPPMVKGIQALPDGAIRLSAIGASNQIYTVSASSSLADPNWIPIGPAFANGTNVVYFDRNATNYPQRFYRFSLP